jgi:hypothetical protein
MQFARGNAQPARIATDRHRKHQLRVIVEVLARHSPCTGKAELLRKTIKTVGKPEREVLRLAFPAVETFARSDSPGWGVPHGRAWSISG